MADLRQGRQTYLLHPDNDIEADPDQPRVHFGRQELLDLQANIRSEGMHDPIHVISNPDFGKEKGAKRYRIVAGERRWRAVCELELPEIEAFIVQDNVKTLVFQLTENLHRKDLSAVEEARGYARLQREYRMSIEDIARKVGRSSAHIRTQLKLLGLHPDLQRSNMEGGLSAHVGTLLVDNCATLEEQLAVVAELRPRMHGTGRIRARAVKRWFEARDRRRGHRKGSGRGRLPKVSTTVLEGIGPVSKKLAEFLEEFAGPEGSGELQPGKFFSVWHKLAPEGRAELLRAMRTIHERSGVLLKFFEAQRNAAIGAARKAAWERSRGGKKK